MSKQKSVWAKSQGEAWRPHSRMSQPGPFSIPSSTPTPTPTSVIDWELPTSHPLSCPSWENLAVHLYESWPSSPHIAPEAPIVPSWTKAMASGPCRIHPRLWLWSLSPSLCCGHMDFLAVPQMFSSYSCLKVSAFLFPYLECSIPDVYMADALPHLSFLSNVTFSKRPSLTTWAKELLLSLSFLYVTIFST